MKKKMPANLRKLLEWLDGVSPLLETKIVAAGLSHTLDKALTRNFAEMNLREATVSITARGRDALSKFPVTCLRTSPRISDRETAASLPAYRRGRSLQSAIRDGAWRTLGLAAGPALMGSTVRPGHDKIALDHAHGERGHRQRSLPQSSSASRFTAGAAGFLNLSQSMSLCSRYLRADGA